MYQRKTYGRSSNGLKKDRLTDDQRKDVIGQMEIKND